KAVAKALEPQEPDWASLQKQTGEYAKLASDFGKADPPKGDKDSWSKLTLAFATSAAELDRAAQAKNRDAALDAHEKIAGSCMQCHREHRMMGMGRGGMGMPPGGRGKGGPRPGSPRGGDAPPG